MLPSLLLICLQFLYTIGALGLAAYGLQALWLTWLRIRAERTAQLAAPPARHCSHWPSVTVQLPVYNELHVISRLIDACVRLDYPSDRLQIQILDDSTDSTTATAEQRAAYWRKKGHDVQVLHRNDRQGYKAGALQAGIGRAAGEFIAIFDADFVPTPDFLRRVLPVFLEKTASSSRVNETPQATKGVGFIQTRWAHLNAGYSALTRAQAMALDGHFVVEQAARASAGLPFSFNGSAGVWRRACIEDNAVGSWQTDTLCEDLDLSYRAQLAGWRGVYLDHVEAPAEIPPQLLAFKQQQFRWAKGSIETLRKLRACIWQGTWSLPKRIAALGHLSGYLIHPLLLVLLLVMPLLMLFGIQPYWPLAYLSLVSVGPPTLYALAQWHLHPDDWLTRWAYLPVLTLLGMGLSLNNTVAALQALAGSHGAFLRTPKFHVERQTDTWQGSRYSLRLEPVIAGELFLAIYAAVSSCIAILLNQWWNLPFLALYTGGYSLVAALGIYEDWAARATRICPQRTSVRPLKVRDLVKFWGR